MAVEHVAVSRPSAGANYPLLVAGMERASFETGHGDHRDTNDRPSGVRRAALATGLNTLNEF